MLNSPPAIPYWRLSGFYLAYLALLGGFIPYWNLYLARELHFTPALIGQLMAITIIPRLLAPCFWGHVADRSGRGLAVVRLGVFMLALLWLALAFTTDYRWLALWLLACTFFQNAVMAPFEAVTLTPLHGGYMSKTFRAVAYDRDGRRFGWTARSAYPGSTRSPNTRSGLLSVIPVQPFSCQERSSAKTCPPDRAPGAVWPDARRIHLSDGGAPTSRRAGPTAQRGSGAPGPGSSRSHSRRRPSRRPWPCQRGRRCR